MSRVLHFLVLQSLGPAESALRECYGIWALSESGSPPEGLVTYGGGTANTIKGDNKNGRFLNEMGGIMRPPRISSLIKSANNRGRYCTDSLINGVLIKVSPLPTITTHSKVTTVLQASHILLLEHGKLDSMQTLKLAVSVLFRAVGGGWGLLLMHLFFPWLVHSFTLPGTPGTPLSIPSGFCSKHQI